MMGFHQAYQAAQQAMEAIIVQGLFHAYLSGLSMIFHGSWDAKAGGMLMVIGLTAIIMWGAWKMVRNVFGHWLLGKL